MRWRKDGPGCRPPGWGCELAPLQLLLLHLLQVHLLHVVVLVGQVVALLGFGTGLLPLGLAAGMLRQVREVWARSPLQGGPLSQLGGNLMGCMRCLW